MICNNFRRLVELVSGQMQQQCEACQELNQIRATLMTNFGKNDNPYGFVIKDEGDTHNMLVQVLKGLTQQDEEQKEVDWSVFYVDGKGEERYQIVKGPTAVHASVLFARLQIPHQRVSRIEPTEKTLKKFLDQTKEKDQEVEIHDSEPSTGRKTDIGNVS